MAVSKVVYGNQTLIDLTGDTVTADTLIQGVTAHSKSGVQLTGTAVISKYGVGVDVMFGELSYGTLQRPTGGNVDLILTDFRGIANSAMYYKFYRCDNLKTVTFADLELLTQSTPLNYCFGTCVNLESVSFPKLATIGTSSATSTNYRHMYYAFNGCTKLTTLTFPELTAIYCNGTGASHGSFYGNDTIQKLYFPKLATISKASGYSNSTAANNVFASMSALTEIHFALTNKTAIQSSTGYATAWGSSATIYFDL